MSMEKKLAKARQEGFNLGWQACADEGAIKSTFVMNHICSKFHLDEEQVQLAFLEAQEKLLTYSDMSPRHKTMTRRALNLFKQGNLEAANELSDQLLDEQNNDRLGEFNEDN